MVLDEQSDHDIDAERWAHLAQRSLRAEGVARGELTVTFVDEDAITELNRTHMGGDGPTDVLSFPIDDLSAADGGPSDPDVPVLLGDVVICPAVAARNAAAHAAGGHDVHPGHPDHDGTTDSEIALLVVYGVLHVLGYDHAEEDERLTMQAAERRLLATPPPGGDR